MQVCFLRHAPLPTVFLESLRKSMLGSKYAMATVAVDPVMLKTSSTLGTADATPATASHVTLCENAQKAMTSWHDMHVVLRHVSGAQA